MNAWDHLPNAQHIDWVIDSVKQHPEIWTAAWDAAWDANSGAAWKAAREAACGAARDATWEAARGAAWQAAWEAARGVTDDATRNAARVIGTSAALALVAYDDCAHLLEMSSDRLKTWALLSEQPAAALLLPAVIARERIAQLNAA